jgi:hypothetical protein
MKTKPRFRLIQDDDSHWYVIPSDQLEAFQRWVTAAPYWEGYSGRDFDADRINGPPHFTFADWMEDE